MKAAMMDVTFACSKFLWSLSADNVWQPQRSSPCFSTLTEKNKKNPPKSEDLSKCL